MIDHVSITVADLLRAARFYDAVMPQLGLPCVRREADMLGYGRRSGPDDEAPGYLSIRVSEHLVADRRHWAFRAPNRAAVRAFHAAGLASGGQDDGGPGLRPEYHAAYYAAFLRDPDGNRIEAVCHRSEPSP